jgi:peroxiredoxin
MFKKMLAALAAFILLSSFKPQSGYKVGDKATDFKLKNVDGKMVAMGDDKDAKGYIVVFTCNHCPFAKKYEDRIVALDKKYRPKGYPVIAINPNDPQEVPEDNYQNMITRAKEKNFTFPYVVDETQGIAKTYGATRTPHVFVVQKVQSDFVVRYIGAIDDNSDDPSAVKQRYVEDAVDNLMAGKTVNPDFVKAIGCTIKWKAKS